jgi:hypothetical protein
MKGMITNFALWKIDLPPENQSRGAFTFKKLPKEDPTPFGVGLMTLPAAIVAGLV